MNVESTEMTSTTVLITEMPTTESQTTETSTNPPTEKKGTVVTESMSTRAVSPRLQKLSQQGASTAKPLIIEANEESKGIVESIDVNDVFANTYGSQENNDFEKQDRGNYKLDVHYSDLDFIRKLNEEDYIRRAPSRNSGVEASNIEEKLNEAETQQQSTTPLFYIVDDPHRNHRERILQQLIEFERTTTSTTPPPIKPLDSRFALPESREKLGIFLLSNGAKLTDYKWFGLYNHCDNVNLSLLSL